MLPIRLETNAYLFFKNGKQVYCGGSMTAPINVAVEFQCCQDRSGVALMVTKGIQRKRLGAVLRLALAASLLMAPTASAATKVCEGGQLMGASTKAVSVSAGQKIDSEPFRVNGSSL